MNEIVVSKELRDELCELFKVTYKTVWEALSYRSNSPTSRRIRKVATDKGGINLGTLMTTEHYTASGLMVHRFGPRVRIEYDRQRDRGTLYVDDEEIEHLDSPTIVSYEAFQRRAVDKANRL